MATLVFSALGSAVAGPLGGALGALIGRRVDSAIIGSPMREGPRLKELAVTTSTYGAAIPRQFGRMRVGGTIIWATDLVEHKAVQGGGKGRPSVTSYSYSASFAVALSSRRLLSIGRVWADGKLLRGAAGDLKVGGAIRFHPGHEDQSPDPLIAAAEGAGMCPGYRGTAYVVFEDLQLSEFGNRIPALTFEVFADETIDAAALLAGTLGVSSTVQLDAIGGLSCEGSFLDIMQQFESVLPLLCDVRDDTLHISTEPTTIAALLPEATIAVADDAFGGKEGFAQTRSQAKADPAAVLRYYDIDRDYQPGVQRAPGRSTMGQGTSIEFPCALSAEEARRLVETASRRTEWARHAVAWRTAQLDERWRPGALVRIPGQGGAWRITDWEWRGSGLELSLVRTPLKQVVALTGTADAGRAGLAADQLVGQTWIAAFELPWDGAGAVDCPLVQAAVSSSAEAWTGAALYVDQGDGQLIGAGSSGTRRSVAGEVLGTLPAASPLVADRSTVLQVRLLDARMQLIDATARQIAMGANRALVGSEYIQFAKAVPVGNSTWELSGLLRGRGGTEHATTDHAPGETFILIDDACTPLDGRLVGAGPAVRVAAVGLADPQPASAAIACRGLTLRPLSPVHPRAGFEPEGDLVMQWTRRARGAWEWRDQVDAPLREESEQYDVVLGPPDNPLITWRTSEPRFRLPAAQVAALGNAHPGATLAVRQVGDYSSSLPLLLHTFR